MKQFVPEEIHHKDLNAEQESIWSLIQDQLPEIKHFIQRKLHFLGFNSVEAEDLEQKTYLQLLRLSEEKIENLRKENCLVPYAGIIAKNKANDYFRRKKIEEQLFVQTDVVLCPPLAQSLTGNTELEIVSMGTLVWREIKNLNFRQRAAIILNKRSDELINFIIRRNLIGELSAALCCTPERLNVILNQFPLKDSDIALLYEEIEGRKCTPRMVQDARYSGQLQIQKLGNISNF